MVYCLLSRGPAFGYFPESSKSYLVVPEYCRATAEAMFQDLGVHIATGHLVAILVIYVGGMILYRRELTNGQVITYI